MDEYGGIAGCVYLDDIIEELVGPVQQKIHSEQIQQTGPLEYRLSGDLAIHDWADVFGIDNSQIRITTVAGLVTAVAGRILTQGEKVQMKNINFLVEKTEGHRIKTILLKLSETERETQNK